MKARLKDKLKNQLNSGIVPEILSLGAKLAVFHIKAGVRRFPDLAQAVADDLDTTPDQLQRCLRSLHNGARDLMEDSDVDVTGMDDPSTVSEVLRSGAFDRTSKGSDDATISDKPDSTPDPAPDGQPGSGHADSRERQGDEGGGESLGVSDSYRRRAARPGLYLRRRDSRRRVDTIPRSMGARQRMSDRNEGGVALNPRLNTRLRQEQAPGLYTE